VKGDRSHTTAGKLSVGMMPSCMAGRKWVGAGGGECVCVRG